jgi:hypothetical protein
VNSRSDEQLRSPNEVNNTKDCKPEATHHGNPVVPCGLVAWSLFNDTYSFARGNEMLMVHKRGISWRSERDNIFGKQVFPRNFQNGSVIGGGTLDPRIPVSLVELCCWNTGQLSCFGLSVKICLSFLESEV